MARHPIFMGLRSDKKARDVRIEKSTTMAKLKKAAKKSAATKKGAVIKSNAKPQQKKSTATAKT
jgi:hypothetical protein